MVFQKKVKILEKKVLSNQSGNLAVSKDFQAYIREKKALALKPHKSYNKLNNILSSITSLNKDLETPKSNSGTKKAVIISSASKYYLPALEVGRHSWNHKSSVGYSPTHSGSRGNISINNLPSPLPKKDSLQDINLFQRASYIKFPSNSSLPIKNNTSKNSDFLNKLASPKPVRKLDIKITT